jgi:hypothetical protein
MRFAPRSLASPIHEEALVGDIHFYTKFKFNFPNSELECLVSFNKLHAVQIPQHTQKEDVSNMIDADSSYETLLVSANYHSKASS